MNVKFRYSQHVRKLRIEYHTEGEKVIISNKSGNVDHQLRRTITRSNQNDTKHMTTNTRNYTRCNNLVYDKQKKEKKRRTNEGTRNQNTKLCALQT